VAPYPATAADRDRFVLSKRLPRAAPDPWQYQDLLIEDERTAAGTVEPVATVFLTGRECPWRCVMCDLWKHTTGTDTPRGAIAAQVAAAVAALRHRADPVVRTKLYNAGSFFDPRAVPDDDYDGVAASLSGFVQLIVESHPALVGPRMDRLLDALERRRPAKEPATRLEVAMGLETAHTGALERLQKRMTVDDFSAAADALRRRGVTIRVFLLISPPFVPPDEQDAWLCRSVDLAFACGAAVVSLVPTRPGNGALDALVTDGLFCPPSLTDIERSADAALAQAHSRGRVFVDLWDIGRFANCTRCLAARRERLQAMNLEQRATPRPICSSCGNEPAA
jgi:radical SAM enzyme (TIGR01210 family)